MACRPAQALAGANTYRPSHGCAGHDRGAGKHLGLTQQHADVTDRAAGPRLPLPLLPLGIDSRGSDGPWLIGRLIQLSQQGRGCAPAARPGTASFPDAPIGMNRHQQAALGSHQASAHPVATSFQKTDSDWLKTAQPKAKARQGCSNGCGFVPGWRLFSSSWRIEALPERGIAAEAAGVATVWRRRCSTGSPLGRAG